MDPDTMNSKDRSVNVAGLWFGTAAVIACAPLALIPLFYLLAKFFSSTLTSAQFLHSSVGALNFTALPFLLAYVLGGVIGTPIVKGKAIKSIPIFARGALIAILTMAGMLLVGDVVLPGIGIRPVGGGGDVPGAAMVLGYMFILPLMILVAGVVGGSAGLMLRQRSCRNEDHP